MLTRAKTDPVKESERNRQADVASAKQRVAETEDRLAAIEKELEALAEADVEEMKRRGRDKPSSPPLCSLIVKEEDLRIEKGSAKWEAITPARQRVLERAHLDRERRQKIADLRVQRGRLTDRQRMAAVKLTPANAARLQERVNDAARDLALREALAGVFQIEDEGSTRRAGAVLRAGEALGITPTED